MVTVGLDLHKQRYITACALDDTGTVLAEHRRLDAATIRKLYDDVAEWALDSEHARAAETHRAEPGLLAALGRYRALADSPADAKVLGLLISKEIHYRLLPRQDMASTTGPAAWSHIMISGRSVSAAR